MTTQPQPPARKMTAFRMELVTAWALAVTAVLALVLAGWIAL